MNWTQLGKRAWIAGFVLIVLYWVGLVSLTIGYIGMGLTFASWAIPYVPSVQRWFKARLGRRREAPGEDGLEEEYLDARAAAAGDTRKVADNHAGPPRRPRARWTVGRVGNAIWAVGFIMWLLGKLDIADRDVLQVGWWMSIAGLVLSFVPGLIARFARR